MVERKRRLTKEEITILVGGFVICVALLLVGGLIGRVTKPTEVETITKKVYVPITKYITITATNSVSENIDESTYYDVPLSESLQEFIATLCEEENVPESLVYSMIETESQFDPDVISDTEDYGLMQINSCNHEWLAELYEVEDFLDPYDNVFCGIKIVGSYLSKYGDYNQALMCYNMGESGAKALWEKGIYSSSYSREIVSGMSDYEEGVDIGK